MPSAGGADSDSAENRDRAGSAAPAAGAEWWSRGRHRAYRRLVAVLVLIYFVVPMGRLEGTPSVVFLVGG